MHGTDYTEGRRGAAVVSFTAKHIKKKINGSGIRTTSQQSTPKKIAHTQPNPNRPDPTQPCLLAAV